MDKAALEMKLREIHKALCLRIEEKHFTPLYEDVTCWRSWNALHVIAIGYGCDIDYVSLIQECLTESTRIYLGDIA